MEPTVTISLKDYNNMLSLLDDKTAYVVKYVDVDSTYIAEEDPLKTLADQRNYYYELSSKYANELGDLEKIAGASKRLKKIRHRRKNCI